MPLKKPEKLGIAYSFLQNDPIFCRLKRTRVGVISEYTTKV